MAFACSGTGLDRPALHYVVLAVVMCVAAIGVALAAFVRGLGRRRAVDGDERRWRRILEALPPLVWTATPDGLADYFSPQSLAFTGLRQDALLGWGWLDAIHPDDRASCKRTWSRAVADGRDYQSEQRFRRFDGEYRWLSCHGTPVRDADGSVVRWAGVFIDVTEGKRAEARAQGARRHLDLTMPRSNSSLWDIAIADGDASRGHTVSNDYLWAREFEVRSLFDVDFQTILSRVAMVPEDRESFTRAMQKSIEGDALEFEVEFRSRGADGTTRWRLVRGSVSRDPTGKPAAITGVGVDLTNLKRAEGEIRALRERLELAILGSNARTGDHKLVDGKAIRFTGRRVHTTDLKLPVQELRESEERFRAIFGNAAVGMAVTVTPGRLGECNQRLPTHVLAIDQDISVRQSLEQEARKATELLELGIRGSELSIFDFQMPDGAIERSQITLINFWEQLGYELADAPRDFGAAASIVLAPEEQEPVQRAIGAYLAGAVTRFEIEHRLLRKDGSFKWVLARGTAIRDANGVAIRFIGSHVDITGRKEIEERLRESERRWRSLTEALPQLIWTAAADGTIEYLSRQACEYTGLSEQQLLGDGWANAIHPDDLPRTGKSWVEAVRAQKPHEVQHRLRRFDGAYRWFTTRAEPARDAEGRVFEWVGSSTDITAQKELEAQLRQTNERLEVAIRSANTKIWGYDVSNGTPALTNVWGASHESRDAPLAMADLIHPDDLPRVAAEIRAYLSGETATFETEHRAKEKDGSYRWVIGRGVASRDPDTGTVRFLGASVDISDRKTLETELRHSKERLEVSIRSSKMSIWEYDMPDGVLAHAKQNLTNFWESLDYDPLAVPTAMTAIIHPEDIGRVMQEVRDYLCGETRNFETEHRVRHCDGGYRWVLGRGVALREPGSKAVRFVGTNVDITEIKRIEGELQSAREAAESANRAKDEFLANVSHEIRTPMNAILGMTELALDSAKTDQQKQLLSTVKSAAKNLLGIINDLLDFSKIAAGKLALDEADFWLRAEVGETLRALAARAHRKGVELICHVHPDVPDALLGDAGRVRQVLMNLVGNALKFTARGEVVVEVLTTPDARSATHDDRVSLVFAVRDTGIGIARDKQAAIFRAFEQEDSSTTRRYGGTGLGLTISAQLAALMDGGIAVESEPGNGSTFTFTARFSRAPRLEAEGTPSPEMLEGCRALVVDDNETNRGILGEWLTNWRMRPFAVGDAKSALDELASADGQGDPYVVVLLDGRMPDVDGVALARQILRRYGSSKRLILLSSDDSPILAARSREAGIHAYLLKPVQQSDLVDAICTVMNATIGDPRASRTASDAKMGASNAAPSGARALTLRILVAEDNELNAALLRTLLKKRGHRAQFAEDGRSALALASEASFDLMLLDLHMPEMDGFEVVRAIREREIETGRHLPIVALTARSSNRDRGRCLAAGMDDFLPKPTDADALWATIERMIAAFPPAGPRTSRLLDARAVLRACAGDEDVFETLCSAFRHGLPDNLTRVRCAFLGRDLPRVSEAAHKLCGTLAAFSSVASAVALTLEDAAQREDVDSCAELVGQLESMCPELLEDTRSLTLADLSL